VDTINSSSSQLSSGGSNATGISGSASPVPEPGAAILTLLGFVGVFALRQRINVDKRIVRRA
jgi:hypothetical protein